MDRQTPHDKMMALIDDMQKAEAAGDHAQMMELAAQMSAISDDLRAETDALTGNLPPETLTVEYQRLRDAIEGGDLVEMQAALVSGLDLNAPQGPYKSVPLTWALMAEDRSPDVVRLLLEHGADAAHASEEGYTALHFIADTNFIDKDVERPSAIIRLLVDAGADLEARQHYGWTPLLRAVIEGMPVELDALLRAGANPNVTVPHNSMPYFVSGQTALMAAGSDTAKVHLLLEHGADPSATSLNGETTLSFFARESAEARASYLAKLVAGQVTDFDWEYAEGFEGSLALIQSRLAQPN